MPIGVVAFAGSWSSERFKGTEFLSSSQRIASLCYKTRPRTAIEKRFGRKHRTKNITAEAGAWDFSLSLSLSFPLASVCSDFFFRLFCFLFLLPFACTVFRSSCPYFASLFSFACFISFENNSGTDQPAIGHAVSVRDRFVLALAVDSYRYIFVYITFALDRNSRCSTAENV